MVLKAKRVPSIAKFKRTQIYDATHGGTEKSFCFQHEPQGQGETLLPLESSRESTS